MSRLHPPRTVPSRHRRPGPALGLLALLLGLLLPGILVPAPARAGGGLPGVPLHVGVSIPQGTRDLLVTWDAPTVLGDGPLTGFALTLDGDPVGQVGGDVTETTLDGAALGLRLGHTYRVGVAALNATGAGALASAERQLTVNANTPVLDANPTNPLAGHEWGVYRGNAELAYVPWLKQPDGALKDKLALLAMTPKAKFFGDWIEDSRIKAAVRDYVANSTGGDPSVMSLLTIFRMAPWESEACQRGPTQAEIASYRRWMRAFAEGLGDALATVWMQPDGPFVNCPLMNPARASKRSRDLSGYLRWAVRTLDALPHTTVYIEMGSADWFRDDPSFAVTMLRRTGVADVRGFALDTSHFDSIERQVVFGKAVLEGLARHGITGKHFVIDTSDNGRAFHGAFFHRYYPEGVPVGEAPACRHRTTGSRPCVSLGVPPTTDVANPRWHLCDNLATDAGLPDWSCDADQVAAWAATYVDAYLWIGRPWLHEQRGPFSMERATLLLRTNRFSPWWRAAG